METRRPHTTSNDSAQVQVDSDSAIGVFADATHVVEAGHNVLIFFATRNYPSGEESRATTHFAAYMNYYTTKRLEAALSVSVQRHASVFGNVKAQKTIGQSNLEDKTKTIYANFVRLTGSPEELTLDLGLNPKPVGAPTDPIPIAYTVIIDYYTATTFLRQVSSLIAEYEAKNGPIETDIQKRVDPRVITANDQRMHRPEWPVSGGTFGLRRAPIPRRIA